MIFKCGVTDYVTFFITYASACKFSMFGGFFVGRSLNTVMSEIQYALPYNRLGYSSASIWDTYKHSKYVDSASPFFQKTNSLGGALQWMGCKRKLSWFLAVGAGWDHASCINMSKPFSQCLPLILPILHGDLLKMFCVRSVFLHGTESVYSAVE